MKEYREGQWMYQRFGMLITIPSYAKQTKECGFHIYDKDRNKIHLSLVHGEEVVFHVHRDPFHGKEWEVVMEDPY